MKIRDEIRCTRQHAPIRRLSPHNSQGMFADHSLEASALAVTGTAAGR